MTTGRPVVAGGSTVLLSQCTATLQWGPWRQPSCYDAADSRRVNFFLWQSLCLFVYVWWRDTVYDDVTLCMMTWHCVWWCDTMYDDMTLLFRIDADLRSTGQPVGSTRLQWQPSPPPAGCPVFLFFLIYLLLFNASSVTTISPTSWLPCFFVFF